MSAVHSKGNLSTELRLRDLLVSNNIDGWRTNASEILGKPDFVFDKEKVIVFVDGCFWHGCNKHCSIPRSNTEYWENKIKSNVARDKHLHRKLRYQGWHVLRIWEHELEQNPQSAIRRIARKLNHDTQNPN